MCVAPSVMCVLPNVPKLKAVRFGHFATEMRDNPEEDDVLLLNGLWLAMLLYKKVLGRLHVEANIQDLFGECLQSLKYS